MQVVVNLQAVMSTQTVLKCKVLSMNSGKKILISCQASSRYTPETASAAEHGYFLSRAALTFSFFSIDFNYDFFSLAVASLLLRLLVQRY